MSILGINEVYGVGGLFEALSATREREEEKSGESNILSPKDTVSFSAEALAMAAQRAPVQSGEAAAKNKGAKAGTEEDEENQAESSDSGGFMESMGSGDSTARIEKQIQQLQEKMAEVASSSLPDEVKQGQMGALQGAISAFQQQLNELKQAAAAEVAKA